MKRLQIYKAAGDFAFATIETDDGAQLDAAMVSAWEAAKLDPLDYTYWKNSFLQQRANFKNLSNQLAPSGMVKK